MADKTETKIDRTKLNLTQRLMAIHARVSFLKKDSQGFGFKYVASSDVLLAIREVMGEVGVLLVPSMTQIENADHTTKKGNHEWITRIWFDMTWVNVDDPIQTLTCKWYAFGSADGEQGVGIAATYAEKFFLLKFFNIATDEVDPDTSANQKKRAEANDAGAAAAKKTAAKPSTAPAATATPAPAAAATTAPAAATPPTAPKYIELVLNSPKHNAILKAYMAFNKADKVTMRARLASLWDAQNHEEKAYLVAVEKDLTIAQPEAGDDLPF